MQKSRNYVKYLLSLRKAKLPYNCNVLVLPVVYARDIPQVLHSHLTVINPNVPIPQFLEGIYMRVGQNEVPRNETRCGCYFTVVIVIEIKFHFG